MHTDYFPLGIARDGAFFGREAETKRLLNNITIGKHTLLTAPRRYGKTSLAKHVIKIAKLPYTEIDLFLIMDDKSIEYKIIKGVCSLIQAVSDTPEQWFGALRDFFNQANKKWTIGIQGVTLKLTPSNHNDIADNILDALNALEYILQSKKQKAVLFIDEFQEITKSKVGGSIEGAIRHFAQESKYLSFIFSGSNRNILLGMFNDQSRPLYALCDHMVLNRIEPSYYKKYLNEIAKKTWHQSISAEVFANIIKLTQIHPHYVYVLCGYIWQNFPTQEPTPADVVRLWDTYLDESIKEVRAELYKLSPGQLKVLTIICLAKYPEITGKDVQRQTNLTSGTIVYALRILEDMDYIEKQGAVFRIINPVVYGILERFYKEII